MVNIEVKRQIDIVATMTLPAMVVVDGRECDTLVGRYRDNGDVVGLAVELWEHYDPPPVTPGHAMIDTRQPIYPVLASYWKNRPTPPEVSYYRNRPMPPVVDEFVDHLVDQMRLAGMSEDARARRPL